MKKKLKTLLLLTVLCFSLTILSTSCNNPENQITQETDGPTTSINIETNNSPQYGKITDPEELEAFWQEFIYDSIGSVLNARNFNSANEIKSEYIGKFCFAKFIEEHGADGLELEKEDGRTVLFPLETALTYAERYFDLTDIDLTDINPGYYNAEKEAFIFIPNTNDKPSYKDKNAWGIILDSVTRDEDGTVTVVMIRKNQSGQTDLIRTLILKTRDDGSPYFASGKWEYIDNNIVTIDGRYKDFSKIIGFEEELNALSMLGENNGNIILSYTPYDEEKNTVLMLVDPETMSVSKELKVDGNCSITDISALGEKIFIRLDNRLLAVEKNLETTEEIALPDIIKDKLKREVTYNENGNPDIFFGGYDYSPSDHFFVYADEEGLKLFKTDDNTEILLSKTLKVSGSDLLENSFHFSPRFVDDGKKIITTMSGYEGTMGYTVCNLLNGEVERFDISGEASSTGYIRYDSGILEVNNYIRDENGENGDYKTLFFDFQTNEIKEITLEDRGDTGNIIFPGKYYIGENYAAFITSVQNPYNNTKNMEYINRIDLDTLEVEVNLISIKAADTSILGVLSDGRVVFRYYYNPSESGIGITK